MKRFLFVFAVLCVVGVSVWAALTLTSTREAGAGHATARDGAPVDVGAVPGARVTIVHFWGTWCEPCRDELPLFAKFLREHSDPNVGVVTVADDPDFATVDRFLASEGIALDPVVLDSRGTAGRAWNVHVYPTTFLIGPSNEILAVYRGPVDWASPLQRREILRLCGLEP